jgi:catechol 2,3-dioxygenase-like lactoylglutathione lyase family enzyme
LHHVALTVSDLDQAQKFWTELLGLPLLMRTETFCALLTGADRLQALFLTTHEGTREGPFSEFTVGLDHVCLTVDSAEALAAWRQHLGERGVAHSYQRSEWGHHINLRDPDNIAVELFLLEPDEASAEILAPADRVSS